LERFEEVIVNISLLFGEVVCYEFGNDWLDVSDTHAEIAQFDKIGTANSDQLFCYHEHLLSI
jgi:hypothetical protein